MTFVSVLIYIAFLMTFISVLICSAILVIFLSVVIGLYTIFSYIFIGSKRPIALYTIVLVCIEIDDWVRCTHSSDINRTTVK